MKTRRNFLITGSLAAISSAISFRAIPKGKPKEITITPEWRNQQSDMSYRMLGRTGLMISEVVNGGDRFLLKIYGRQKSPWSAA